MPGQLYTVNDSLQEILTRQKLEARQAMLDELSRKDLETKWRQQELENTRNRERDDLNRRQVEAGITNTTENTESLRDQRKILGEAKVLDQIGSMFAPGEQLPPDMDPEVSSVLDKYQRTQKTFTPSVDGETEGTQDVNKVYRGSPKDLEEKRVRQRIQQYLQDPDIPEEVRKALQFQSELPGVSMPAGMFGRADSADIQLYKYAVSQGYKGPIQQFLKEKANYDLPNPASNQPFIGIGPDGKPVMLGYNPRTNSASPINMPSSVATDQPLQRPGTVPNPNQTNKYPPVLSDNASQDLADLRARTGGWVGGQVRRQAAARIQNGIGNAKVNPQVRQVALQIIGSPTYDNKDAMEIVQEYRNNLGPNPSPQDVASVDQLEALLVQTIGIKPRE